MTPPLEPHRGALPRDAGTSGARARRRPGRGVPGRSRAAGRGAVAAGPKPDSAARFFSSAALDVVAQPSAALTGRRLGVFEVLGLLGVGGMGEVYRARDTRLRREVAIKILPRAVRDDPARVARFAREARLLASLNHPHIGTIHGLEEADGVTALVMELVEGDDFAQRLVRGPLPIEEALTIARQIAEALEAAHTQGVVHRDVKPANIQVRRDGTVKVLDFGLAKAPTADADEAPTLPAMPTLRSGARCGCSRGRSRRPAGPARRMRSRRWTGASSSRYPSPGIRTDRIVSVVLDFLSELLERVPVR